MTRAVRNLLAALATGYILSFHSERLFWTVLWPGTHAGNLAATWLAYSAIAYLFLAIVWWSAADDAASIFLCGAIYGWLVEGGLARTLYGTELSAPWPWSISTTGLWWHGLLSATVGWWATRRALAAERPGRLAGIAAAVGAFWGLWAMFPRRETPPVLVSVEQFGGEALAMTVLLAASWWVFAWVGDGFRPGWLGTALSLVAVGVFYAQHVAAVGAARAAALPALLAGAAGLLYLRRRMAGARVAGARRESSFKLPLADRPARLATLFVMPLTATLVFWVGVEQQWDRLPVDALVYDLGGPTGFALLGGAALATWWQAGQRPDKLQAERL